MTHAAFSPIIIRGDPRDRLRPRRPRSRDGRSASGCPAGRHGDLDDQRDRGRRSPGERRGRAGRAGPHVAAPERSPASTTGRRSPRSATARSGPSSTRSGRWGSGSATRAATSGSSPAAPSGSCPTSTRSRAGSWATSRSGSEPRTGSAFQADGARSRCPGRRAADRPPAERAVRLGRRRPPRACSAGSRWVPGGATTTRRGSSRARSSRSSAWPCPSTSCPIRPEPTRSPAGAGSTRPAGSPTRRSPPTWPRPGPPARLETDPTEAWGNAAIPGFGIGRPVSPSRSSTRRVAAPGPGHARRGGPGRRGPSRSTPRRSSSRRRRTLDCWSRSARPVSRSPGNRTASWSGSWARSWPSSRRWSWPPSLSGGLLVLMTYALAAAFAVTLVGVVVVFIVFSRLQRRGRPHPADREGLGQHRRRPQAAPRPAPEPGRRGPRRDELRGGRPRAGDRAARGLRPRPADPRAGRAVGRHEPGGPFAAGGRRELPEPPLGDERPLAPGRDRADSRGSSPTGASSTTTRSTATTRASGRSRPCSWRGSSAGGPGSSSPPTTATGPDRT